MRARTTILVNVQRPTALFGLPPVLFALLLAASLAPLAALLPLGLPVAGLVLSAATLAVLTTGLFRLARRDFHFNRVLRAGWRFHGFDAKRTTRLLQAGGPGMKGTGTKGSGMKAKEARP